jgi:hypothetical protein
MFAIHKTPSVSIGKVKALPHPGLVQHAIAEAMLEQLSISSETAFNGVASRESPCSLARAEPDSPPSP